MKVEKRTIKAIRFKDSTIEAVEELAKQESRTFSNMVEVLVKRELKDPSQIR